MQMRKIKTKGFEKMEKREQMNIVVVGHVDHGKSTVIGRLLADTGSLPEGKLEQVKAMCSRNARPFEYAFLLDALKDEQAQGITIDTARCFFKTAKRDYIIIDAPGHVEFLKNMVTGAARAEAALLVIDAKEGIQENSRRHGYLVSMLGISQVVVLVNKMDLVDWDSKYYQSIVSEYSQFLVKLGVEPAEFIPVSAREGENIANHSKRASWYAGPNVLQVIDGFRKGDIPEKKPLRFPVQDVYKFTELGDDRRIIAGTVESGTVSVGDEIVFLPSGKKSEIKTVEMFNSPQRTKAGPGNAIGFTLRDELYIKRGELMCKPQEESSVGKRFRANIFWMGRSPLIKNKKYKLKIAASRTSLRLVDVVSCIDATDLNTITGKQQLDRHDVAECVLETTRPIAFDKVEDIECTARFVIVDGYDIAGGGIITEALKSDTSITTEHVVRRENHWDSGLVKLSERENVFGHKAKFILLSGDSSCITVAKKLERKLFDAGFNAHYLSIENLEEGMDSDVLDSLDKRDEMVRRLGELARILTGSGQIFITASSNLDRYDIEILKDLNKPNEIMTINIGNDDKFMINYRESYQDNDFIVSDIYSKLVEESIIPDYSI
ncbi:Sulfate adenylyltransferase subunit 1 [Chitinispirillum alkaliphilum]|nr:Sulfate adenylyltransferase subunit 1 [Chitinispirillum alkaliphilum]